MENKAFCTNTKLRKVAQLEMSSKEAEQTTISEKEKEKEDGETEFSYSELRALASCMANDTSLVNDKKYRLKRYTNCFTGIEAVAWLLTRGICANECAAVKLGNRLLQEELLHHVSHDHGFKNEKLFYRFTFKTAFADQEELLVVHDIARKNDIRLHQLSENIRILEERLCRSIKLVQLLSLSFVSLASASVLVWLFGYLYVLPVIFLVYPVFVFLEFDSRLFWSYIDYYSGLNNVKLEPNTDIVADSNSTTIKSVERKSVERTDENMFPVSAEEIEKMRKVLVEDFGSKVNLFFNDEYLASVMRQPNSKKPSERRSFEYSKSKFVNIINSRKEIIDPSLPSAEFYKSETVSTGSLYWHGYDTTGRPILWVRSKLKNWNKLNIKEEVRLHMEILDVGIKLMPDGVTTFHIISDASGLGWKQTNLGLMKELLNLLIRVYPDRLASLHAGPVNAVLRSLAGVLFKLMPARITSKIFLMSKQPFNHLTVEHKLLQFNMIPDFFGGTMSHSFEPEGEFSFEGMVKRQSALLEIFKKSRTKDL